MTFTTITTTDTNVKTPALTRVVGGKNVMAVRSTRRQDAGASAKPQTTILLTSKVVSAAGFRKGARVSILLGTGRDEGKARIVANRNGAYRLGATAEGSSYSLRIRTSKLFNETAATEAVQVTAITKGAVSFAY